MNTRAIVKTAVDLVIAFEGLFVRQQKHPKEKRVLILRKDGLGDCLIFYPTLRAYRNFYPDAKITLVFPDIFKSLGALLTDVDEVIWFDHGAFRSSFTYRRSFILGLKKRGFDVALYPVFSQEKIARKILRIINAKKTVTFDDLKTKEISELARDIDFAKYVTGASPEITFPTISTKALPEPHFAEPNPYVVVFPGTSFALYRRWPTERFADIIEMLLKHNLTPILCGSAKEKSLVADIINHLSPSSKSRVVNLAGKTDFSDMTHLLENAEFYFGSDTGILHLAVAVGTPAIGIIGTGGYKRFFPYGDPAKNRALFDARSMKGKFPIGTWEGVKNPPEGGPHPSIEAITVEQAREEVDYMLEFLYRKNYEKAH